MNEEIDKILSDIDQMMFMKVRPMSPPKEEVKTKSNKIFDSAKCLSIVRELDCEDSTFIKQEGQDRYLAYSG